ncbi:hypothetical protein BDV97DRAFT_346955 [Delphinella strobiligena]|nr:hypothetical protein BDV97DRAFT_346955 [Delphinella strobiligena]
MPDLFCAFLSILSKSLLALSSCTLARYAGLQPSLSTAIFTLIALISEFVSSKGATSSFSALKTVILLPLQSEPSGPARTKTEVGSQPAGSSMIESMTRIAAA